MMKLVIILGVFLLVGLAVASPPNHSRGCIYINGRCSSECEEGTHAYTTGCGFLTPEATCSEPNPRQDTRGAICDYSACYCDPPTVRDTVTKKCVKIEECTKTTE